MPGTDRVLIIVTNVGEYDKVGFRTGLWLGELTHFWDVAAEAGYQMDIASPTGGYAPVDPESLMPQEVGHLVGMDTKAHKHYDDRGFMNRLVDTMKEADADPSAYDAVYMTGGHGACFDFPTSEALAKLTAKFYESGKVVSAVCHGPAGLLGVKLSGGEYLIGGKDLTGFSWKEEEMAKRETAVPYGLEEELKKRGARYSKASTPFKGHVVEDGLLITGQKPASAGAVGEAVVKRLKASP